MSVDGDSAWFWQTECNVHYYKDINNERS